MVGRIGGMIRQPNCKPDLGIDLRWWRYPIDVFAVGAGSERVEPRHVHQRKNFRGFQLRKMMCCCRCEPRLIPPPRKVRRRYQFPILRNPQLLGRPVVRYFPDFGNFLLELVGLEWGWRRRPELAAACEKEGAHSDVCRIKGRRRRSSLAYPNTGRARGRTGPREIGTIGLGGCDHVVRCALADLDSSGEVPARSIGAKGGNLTC